MSKRDLHCPTCGRWLGGTNSPPGYQVDLPPCHQCRTRTLFETGREYPARKAKVARLSGTR